MIENILAFYKRLLSYTKPEWDLNDYPLRYKNQAHPNDKEFKPWVVQIINWWAMAGVGDTKEEAYKMLKEKFENYKIYNNTLPRPGCSVPLQYAHTTMIDNLESVAVDFFDKILGYDYYECFISDDSSLLDFEQSNDETLRKINETYDLQLKEIGDGNIVRILKLIDERNKS
jgi:hypothetical protein